MHALYVKEKAKETNEIQIQLVTQPEPKLNQDECLIKVHSSGINPSDVLATLGYFKHAMFPRIPGRDFSGVVKAGPAEWIGKSVWGTGGAAGISSDGTQAEYIKLPVSALAETPRSMDLLVAGAQLLPYVTAYYSLVKRAELKENETVLIVGALGQVGRAAMSICQWKKCDAIALVRGEQEAAAAKKLGWNVIDTNTDDLAEKILAASHNKQVDVILNSVGNIYWQPFIHVLAEFGRVVTIGARENLRDATVNLFELYRANQTIIGVNTASFDFAENAKLLNELKIGFDAQQLIPLPVDTTHVFSPEQATQAYQYVMQPEQAKRVVISFK